MSFGETKDLIQGTFMYLDPNTLFITLIMITLVCLILEVMKVFSWVTAVLVDPIKFLIILLFDIEESVLVVFNNTNHTMMNSSSLNNEFEQVKGIKSTFIETDPPSKLTETDYPTAILNDHFTIETITNEWTSKQGHPKKIIISDLKEDTRTRASSKRSANVALMSQVEHKKVNKSLENKSGLKK